MKIAMCEDEKVQADFVTSIILDWKQERKIELELDYYKNAESFLFSEVLDYDLLILDIQMGKIDGISLAKKIRESNKTVKILFITGISDYISEGYEVDAMHYLLKPIQKEKLFTLLDKANITIPEEFILLQNNKINLKDIFYIESIGRKVKLKLEDDELLLTSKFTDILPQTKLFPCHRSYAVNISHIKSITKTDLILDNGEQIPVSRRLHKDTCEAFTTYFGEKMYGKI